MKNRRLIEISHGIKYPFVVFEARRPYECKDKSIADLINSERDRLLSEFPRKHLFLYYHEHKDGFAIWKNKYGYEKRMRFIPLGDDKFETVREFYVDGKRARLWQEKSKSTIAEISARKS